MRTQLPVCKKGSEPPPKFWPMSIVDKRLDESRWYLAWRYASAQMDFVLDGDQAPSQKVAEPGAEPPPNFWPMSIVDKRLDGPRWHFAWR